MPVRTLSLIAQVVFHLLVWSGLAIAQDRGGTGTAEAKPSPAKAAEASAAGVEESGLTLYYLKDEDGNLVPVPGFAFEDFRKAYDLMQGHAQQDQRPQFSLQRMSIDAVAKAGHAELNVQLWVLARREGWVRLPLHFDQAVLRESAAYAGPGEQFLHVEPQGDGYVSWIRGPAGAQHQLTLKMLLPLSGAGDAARLKLLVPRATASELKLKVPVGGAVGQVSEGATLLPPTHPQGNTTEFRVLGLGGDFQLTWHKVDDRVAEIPAVLEAEGTVAVRIDSRSVDTKATLLVQSYGAAFDRFRVRLPTGAELTPGSPAGYTVVPLEPEEPGDGQPREVEVRLAKKTSGPVEVRLATRRLRDEVKPPAWIELAGFEVVDAARQWGHVAVAAESDWQVLWGPSRGIRRLDQLPESLQHEDVLAGFEYFAQPYSLTARLVPKKTRTSVEPEYLVLVDAAGVRLEATLKYTVRGAKVFAFDVAMPGWQLDEVGPESLVAVDGVAVSDAGTVTIPLQQPSTGQIEVRLSAHRTVAEDEKPLVIALPQPEVNSPGPAAVVVMPADNVRLIPDRDATTGLVRQQVAPRMELPERQQDPLFYRGDGSKAVFAAAHTVLSQEIDVELAGWLQLGRDSGTMEEKLLYTILHKPVDGATLEVPRSLAEPGRLEVVHEGETLTPVALPETEDSAEASSAARIRVNFPGSCIGRCELTVRYSIEYPEVSPNRPATVSVPLVLPADVPLSDCKLHVTAAREIRAEPRSPGWAAVPNGDTPGRWQLTAEQPARQVQFSLRWEDVDETGVTVVERAWVQTWLTNVARQDRVVFALTSNRQQIELRLPPGAVAAETQILLNNKLVTEPPDDNGRIAISLSSNDNHRRHVLEVLTHYPQQPRRPGRLLLDVPRLAPHVWVRRTYWQVVLPQSEHVIAGPSGFTNESQWGWVDYFWGRRPLLEQPQLESWIDVTGRTPIPDKTTRYLFGSLGPIEPIVLRTASRSWIVLGASGVALVLGLLLIYVPACRHPGALLGLVVVLLCVGVLHPEPMLLVAQAASLGLALTLLAGFLERSVARRRRAVAVPEVPGSALEKGSTQSRIRPVEAGNQSSTQTTPAAEPPAPHPNA